MSSANISETIDIIERHIGHIPYNFIWEFIEVVFNPNGKQDHIYACLYNALSFDYVRSRIKLKLTYDETTRQLVKQAKSINEQFAVRLGTLLERPEFIESIKRKMLCSEAENSIDLDKDTPVSKEPGVAPGVPRSKTQFNLEVIREAPRAEVGGFNRIQYDRQFERCENLIKHINCFCENPRSLSSSDEQTFKCWHCSGLFHAACMRKKGRAAAESCAYCFLERMAPLRRVVRPLFVGLLRKAYKKHHINFFLPEVEGAQKVQVRCVRLKEGAQTACLFPDVACVTLNQQRCCEFELVNKQSCLKYRKDEPFYLRKDYYPGQDNLMVVSETLEPSREKEVRSEAENHLLGIYLIEEVSIDQLIQQVVAEKTLGFSESAAMLQRGFGTGKAEDEISCELIKIPLNCPLTAAKIEIPVRGVFCNHFQCFDLRNYLTLISESVNPRWRCPLCKVLAYDLEVDCINRAIIDLTRLDPAIKEILFFKNGDFAPILDDRPAPARRNIRELNLPERPHTPLRPPPPLPESPPKKLKFVLPDNAEIIDLD